MKFAVYYSSVTGNTRRAAETAEKFLIKEGHDVRLLNTAKGKCVQGRDWIIVIAFWCRRSSMDDLSLKLLEECTHRPILAIGTMGGDAYGSYGRRVAENAVSLIAEKNRCIGVQILQGAVHMERIEKRRKLNPGEAHYISDEKYQHYLSMQGRPGEEDYRIEEAFLKECLSRLAAGGGTTE